MAQTARPSTATLNAEVPMLITYSNGSCVLSWAPSPVLHSTDHLVAA
ncbi:hypothetical protein EDF52_1196 [Curtobacterium sp. PhB42]|nr:hypothetical protein EDF52_1196 [Curtobacterium sp. PhB42]TDW50910.1 hypothetical protein EDF47_11465 [Curtobacterium sp. PhB190]